MTKTTNILNWCARLLAAGILLQTLFFKFTAAEESVYIFTTVGIEPWGRILIGGLELVAVVLLLITPLAWLGAGLALGLMAGAIGMHLTILGIEVMDDGGYLFLLALAVTLCSIYVLVNNRAKIEMLLSSFRRKPN